MVKTTKAQRRALWNLYQRTNARRDALRAYRQFRKTVRPLVASDPCIMVPWAGMWIGIEPDGYTHS